MFILDTNAVSELRKGEGVPSAAPMVAWARSVHEQDLYLSAISFLELEIGVRRLERRDPVQGALLRHWLDERVLPAFAGRVLPIDQDVALCCAGLHVPDPAAERDALIAATGLVHGFAIVTGNAADFTRTGVAVVDPWALA
jgi:predicted nucleic acid-binding protein